MGWHVEQSIWRHPCWGIWNTNTRKSKHFPFEMYHIFEIMRDRHIVTTCVIHAFFSCLFTVLKWKQWTRGTNEPQPRKSLVIHPFHGLLIYNKVSRAVANARGINKIERIQEVACRKELISRHPFQRELCPSNRGFLRQLQNSVCAGRMQLFHQSEMEVSS